MTETHDTSAAVAEILAENERRKARLYGRFDPITGEGSVGKRIKVRDLWLPEAMAEHQLVRDYAATGKIADTDAMERLRILHDFPYWAAKYVLIKCKGGDECMFRLTYPQRKFVAKLESMRLAGKPIRIVLLKARQWGGSTTSQIYMAWLQMVHCQGLNSLIIAHQACATDEIADMFGRMIGNYPVALLHDPRDSFDPDEKKFVSVGRSRAISRVPQRKCNVKIGTAERPNSCRGGDYSLVHLSEVGFWKTTQGKKPEEIVRSACSGVLYKPNTMVVYESTANGLGNFFHREYIAARDTPASQFESLFVAWHEIENNTLDFAATADGSDPRAEFARRLYERRHVREAPNSRQEPGSYLWWLWTQGATLEGINWYVMERTKHSEHGSMAAECPSDDTEAFVNSGASVFDKYLVEALRPSCMMPKLTGDIETPMGKGNDCLEDLRFCEDAQGMLSVWELPAIDAETPLCNAYLTVVDIGGRSSKSDWSVIAVFDRRGMAEGLPPEVVAQWYGHIDMDLLAWKAAQIAAFYDNSLLVIESNTLETHDRDRYVEGDQSAFILNQIRSAYPHLYARRQSAEDVRLGLPRKYGFHTNIATKPMVISTLVKAVREKMYVERDERCLNEMLTYERKPNGAYGAIIGAHDDLLMTRAIGLHICFCEMDLPAPAPNWRDFSQPAVLF